MDKKIFLVKDVTRGEVLQCAFTEESKALAHAQEFGRFQNQEAVLGVVEWDEVNKRGKGVALVYRGVVFLPQSTDELRLNWR